MPVSVAVILWDPGLSRTALKVPVPLVKVLLAGKTPWLVLVKCTVPK